jgi:hypothetical protein
MRLRKFTWPQLLRRSAAAQSPVCAKICPPRARNRLRSVDQSSLGNLSLTQLFVGGVRSNARILLFCWRPCNPASARRFTPGRRQNNAAPLQTALLIRLPSKNNAAPLQNASPNRVLLCNKPFVRMSGSFGCRLLMRSFAPLQNAALPCCVSLQGRGADAVCVPRHWISTHVLRNFRPGELLG